MRLFIVFAVLLFGSIGFCQDAGVPDWVPVDPVFLLPSWLESGLLSLTKLPAIGPYLVLGLKWLSIVTGVTTSVTAAVIAVAKGLDVAFRAVGLAAQADSLEKLAAPVIKALKYVSVFNAQVNK